MSSAGKVIRTLRRISKQRAGAGRDLHSSDPSDVEAVEMYKQPPREGLVPQSGDPEHPVRWVRPSEGAGREQSRQSETALGAHQGNQLASDFADLHNAASKEYKEAFARVGAKMWRGDDAQSLKPKNQDFIAGRMSDFSTSTIESVYMIARPLTVLDSYPEVAADPKLRRQLDREVGQIHRKYTELWRERLEKVGSPADEKMEKDIPWIDEEQDAEEAIHALKDITGAGNTLAGVSVHDNTFGGQRRRARRGNSTHSTKLLKSLSFDQYYLRRGDSAQVLKELPAESIDCAVTSPSYWGPRMRVKDGELGSGTVRGYVRELRAVFRELRKAMKPSGSLWLVLGNGGHGFRGIDVPRLVVKGLVSDRWYLRRMYTWDKGGDVKDSVFHLVVRKNALKLVKLPEVWTFDLSDRFQKGSKFGAFPVELCERVIKASCPANGLVIDPFVGTGTTVIAGLNTGRRVIGIDLSQRELTVARERVAQHRGQGQIARPIKLMKQLMHGVARYDLHVISKQADGEGRFVVAGYASPVLVDQEGHRITREALAGDLPRFMADGGKYANVNILHSNVTVGKIIPTFKDDSGKTFTTRVDDRGLFVVAELRTDPAAPEIVHKVIRDIENGTLRSFSISGNAENPVFTCDGDRCFYDINELELYEITLCEEGVNQEAKFDIVSKDAEAFTRRRA